MLKKSNLMLMAISLTLVFGALATDLMLKSVLLKMDLTDPDRNFQTMPISSFKAIQIMGGNSYAIQLKKGPKFAIKVRNSRKTFLDMSRAGDTLKIGFTVPSTFGNPASSMSSWSSTDDLPVGFVLYCPGLSFVQFSGTDNLIADFTDDSVIIKQDRKTKTTFSRTKFRSLFLEGSQMSWYNFKDSNTLERLVPHLSGDAGINLQGIDCQQLEPVLSENGKIVFFEHSLPTLRNNK